MKVAIVLGTRPEIIKMSPVIRECERLGLDYFILHTGQHYSYNMDKVFFEQLELPNSAYNLDVGSGGHAEQTGRILIGIERVLQKEDPDIVLVQGDTNTVLAGALAAVKLFIRVGHIEAGLRSYDRSMPEEINRILADHCSDYLFAPTEKAQRVLLNEGIAEDKVFVTGNTVVDAVFQNLEISKGKKGVLDDLGLDHADYFLATVHRQENVDNEERLRSIMKGFEKVRREFDVELVCPVHPRTKRRLMTVDIELNGVRLIEPLDYLVFLQLESNARLILTDSGGVQEEACVLGVPCVTLRSNTERPETLEAGANILAGIDPHSIVEKAKLMLSKSNNWQNPFGDGEAAHRIVKILREVIT